MRKIIKDFLPSLMLIILSDWVFYSHLNVFIKLPIDLRINTSKGGMEKFTSQVL